MAILRRKEVYANDIIGDYQSGFMRGKSTIYPIYFVRQVLEKFYEYGKEVYLCFVDFKQAYDSIIKKKTMGNTGRIRYTNETNPVGKKSALPKHTVK